MVVRALAFVIVWRVLGLVGLRPTPDAKDIAIAVLRHQLMVVPRPAARARPPVAAGRDWRVSGVATRPAVLQRPRGPAPRPYEIRARSGTSPKAPAI